jgi:hypothetical protein
MLFADELEKSIHDSGGILSRSWSNFRFLPGQVAYNFNS